MGDLFGWVSAFCFGVCAIPQAYQSIKHGNSHGLSWFFLVLWFLGEVFYMAATLSNFGAVSWIMANIIANTSCLLVVIYYKLFPEGEECGRRETDG
jgi:hypothetical protein